MIFSKKKDIKENPVGNTLVINHPLISNSTNTAELNSKEGYKKNVIAYRAINQVVSAIANIPLEMRFKGKYRDNWEKEFPFLIRPNPNESWDAFIRAAFIDYYLTGEIFITKAGTDKKIVELWHQSPGKMTVVAGKSGIPASYVFKNNGGEKTWPVDQLTGKSDVFFYKAYDPDEYWRGLSPLRAAGLAIDIHNAGMTWNYSLLKNGARASGILKFLGTPTPEIMGRLRESFKKKFQGATNAGEIPMLIEGADWKETDRSPLDMDYINSMKESAKYTAAAIGVPLPLVDNDSSTFNNMETAKELLYTDTVIPLYRGMLGHFNTWLQFYIGPDFELRIDEDDIPALEGVRKRKFERLANAVDKSILTIDEAREALGFDKLGGIAESLFVSGNRVPIDVVGLSDMSSDEKETVQTLRKAKFGEDEIKSIILAGRNCGHA